MDPEPNSRFAVLPSAIAATTPALVLHAQKWRNLHLLPLPNRGCEAYAKSIKHDQPKVILAS